MVEIGLQLGDRAVDLLAECHPVELVEHRLVEALADAVGLWALGLGARVIDTPGCSNSSSWRLPLSDLTDA